MRVKILNRLIAAASAGALSVLVGVTGVSADQEKIILKGITPWTKDYSSSQPFFIFQRLISERLKDKVELKYLGGPEVVSSFEQFEALRNGVVDVILGAAAYYTGQVPEASAMLLAQKSSADLRKTGYFDLMREIHAKKGGVVYLANLSGVPNVGFRLYTKKKVDKADLSGFKIRVSPVYVPLVEGLSGTPVTMPMNDVYTAIERGVVDGYGATYLGIMDFALHEVTKYVVDIPFYSKDNALLMNAQTWEKLPADVREELEKISIEVENQMADFFTKKTGEEDKLLKDAGLEFIRLNEAETAKYYDAAYTRRWDKLIKTSPEYAAKLKELGG
jgi:TRAP-type C4-dicarboxylate transport system substrate-binding protein